MSVSPVADIPVAVKTRRNEESLNIRARGFPFIGFYSHRCVGSPGFGFCFDAEPVGHFMAQTVVLLLGLGAQDDEQIPVGRVAQSCLSADLPQPLPVQHTGEFRQFLVLRHAGDDSGALGAQMHGTDIRVWRLGVLAGSGELRLRDRRPYRISEMGTDHARHPGSTDTCADLGEHDIAVGLDERLQVCGTVPDAQPLIDPVMQFSQTAVENGMVFFRKDLRAVERALRSTPVRQPDPVRVVLVHDEGQRFAVGPQGVDTQLGALDELLHDELLAAEQRLEGELFDDGGEGVRKVDAYGAHRAEPGSRLHHHREGESCRRLFHGVCVARVWHGLEVRRAGPCPRHPLLHQPLVPEGDMVHRILDAAEHQVEITGAVLAQLRVADDLGAFGATEAEVHGDGGQFLDRVEVTHPVDLAHPRENVRVRPVDLHVIVVEDEVEISCQGQQGGDQLRLPLAQDHRARGLRGGHLLSTLLSGTGR